jgi:hypothetical protein
MNPKAQAIYQDFELATSFKNNIDLVKDIKRSVLFENGKQWNMDADIAEYPKITLNLIKQIGKTRKSYIMQNEYGYLINSTNFKSVRKIQDFLKYQAAVVGMRSKDLKALNDDYTKGTAIGYFYWDADKIDFSEMLQPKLGSGGQMRYELIDIRNFCVADNYLQSIQEQEWVMYVTREKISSIKARYKIEVAASANLYTKDTEVDMPTKTEQEELTNVYTKFFRNKDGQVLFTICTQEKILVENQPLNPFYEPEDTEVVPGTMELFDEKGENGEPKNNDSLSKVTEKLLSKFDSPQQKKDKRAKSVWNLYPFARLCTNERDNCFYGLPITLEYIDTQKSVNNHFSIYDKALQDNVLGGYMFRKGVLDAKEITTENGQMLEIDSLPQENIANVFSRLPVANVPSDSAGYSKILLEIARQVAGATNVTIGQADFAGQSGKQTEMLLSRAQENSSDNAMLFNEFKREQAYIMFLFAKFFYENEDFSIIEHGYQEDKQTDYSGENAFNGTDYLNDKVLIDIKVGTAPSFSEYTNIELLGLMVQSGQVPFEAYVSLLPDGYISNKQELIEISKNNSNLAIKKLQEQLDQQKQVIEQMMKAYQAVEKDRQNIDTIVKENIRLKSMLGEISANAIERVSESDKQTADVIREMQKTLQIVNAKK